MDSRPSLELRTAQAPYVCSVITAQSLYAMSWTRNMESFKHSLSLRIEYFNQTECTRIDRGFYAILGTPNGTSALRMLRDHNTELGYHVVEKIAVFGNKELSTDKSESQSMALMLSNCRSRIPIPVRNISK